MKLPDLLKHYDRVLCDIPPKRGGFHLQHLRWMLEEMRGMSGAKVMRWLGFVQGALWTQGIFTIDEMREHNRGLDEPNEPVVRAPDVPGKPANLTIIDFLANRQIMTSRGEARRVVSQRGVKVNDRVVDSITHQLAIGDVIVIGIGKVTFTVTDDDAK